MLDKPQVTETGWKIYEIAFRPSVLSNLLAGANGDFLIVVKSDSINLTLVSINQNTATEIPLTQAPNNTIEARPRIALSDNGRYSMVFFDRITKGPRYFANAYYCEGNSLMKWDRLGIIESNTAFYEIDFDLRFAGPVAQGIGKSTFKGAPGYFGYLWFWQNINQGKFIKSPIDGPYCSDVNFPAGANDTDICFSYLKGNNFKFAKFSGTQWNIENIPDTFSDAPGHSLIVDKDHKPSICYVTRSGELKIAIHGRFGWEAPYLVAKSVKSARMINLIGKTAIVFTQTGEIPCLKLMTFNNAIWTEVEIAKLLEPTGRIEAACNSSGQVAVCYFDQRSGVQKVAISP